jgi:hypothetical protein
MKRFVGILAVFMGLIPFWANCSHHSPSQPEILRDGTIFFSNESPNSLVLSRVVQTHDGRTISRDMNTSVYTHTRYQLTNLFNSTRTFPGGDRVAVYFYSPSYNPYDPNPLYSGDISFTVNGTTVVKILGRDRYELSGN